MLQYMIILLDDTSASFCHYEAVKAQRRLISPDDLRAAVRLAMIENLTIQFVYPDYELPQQHKDIIHSIDHSDIKPLATATGETDVVTLDGWCWQEQKEVLADKVVVLRTTLQDLLAHGDDVAALLAVVQRVNVVITDVEQFTDELCNAYSEWLGALGQAVERLYVGGKSPQINLLTDRMMLTAMNNCGAGDMCITLAPNGRFYVCPAFYYDNPGDSVGDLATGIDIKNKQLYRLDHAPICRHCDAWQCRRCVWLNRRLTLEVNTPGHEQCVMAHLERNASRALLGSLRRQGEFLPGNPEIAKVDYLDPFDKVTRQLY